MAAKNFFGILILLFNMAGLGFILYMAFQALVDHYLGRTSEDEEEPTESTTQKEPDIINDDIIPDEDDLLKNMDLSDLDNLNLDDFD